MIVEAAAKLGFAATLGGATFFAPCAFPLLPGYLAFYLGREGETRAATTRDRLRRAAVVGLVVSAGFAAVFGAVGLVVAAVGTSALANVSVLELVVGGALVVLGVAMAAGRAPSLRVALPERRRSLPGFFLFGVGYAAAAAGCSAPLFVAAVGWGFATGPLLGGATLLAYAAGMSAVMVLATALAALGRDHLLRRLSASTGRIERVAGVLLALAGVAQIWLYVSWLGGPGL